MVRHRAIRLDLEPLSKQIFHRLLTPIFLPSVANSAISSVSLEEDSAASEGSGAGLGLQMKAGHLLMASILVAAANFL